MIRISLDTLLRMEENNKNKYNFNYFRLLANLARYLYSNHSQITIRHLYHSCFSVHIKGTVLGFSILRYISHLNPMSSLLLYHVMAYHPDLVHIWIKISWWTAVPKHVLFMINPSPDEFTKILLLSETHRRPIGERHAWSETNPRPIWNRHAPIHYSNIYK